MVEKKDKEERIFCPVGTFSRILKKPSVENHSSTTT
jgi:hypothetical protein